MTGIRSSRGRNTEKGWRFGRLLGDRSARRLTDGLLGEERGTERERGVQGNMKVPGIGGRVDGGVIIFPGQEIKEAWTDEFS